MRFGGAPNRENGAKRLSALTRRGADSHYGIVNCWPARRCVWPVIAPAQALVRAGAGLRGDARSVGVVCVRCASVIAALSGWFALGSRLPWVLLGWFAFGVRLSLRLCRGGLRSVHACREVLLTRFALVHACCLSFDKQDGLRHLAFLFRRVEIAVRAFSGRSSVIGCGETRAGLRGDARSVGAVCVRCASVIAVLSGRFALGSRLP